MRKIRRFDSDLAEGQHFVTITEEVTKVLPVHVAGCEWEGYFVCNCCQANDEFLAQCTEEEIEYLRICDEVTEKNSEEW